MLQLRQPHLCHSTDLFKKDIQYKHFSFAKQCWLFHNGKFSTKLDLQRSTKMQEKLFQNGVKQVTHASINKYPLMFSYRIFPLHMLQLQKIRTLLHHFSVRDKGAFTNWWRTFYTKKCNTSITICIFKYCDMPCITW